MTAVDPEGARIRISQAYLELARSYAGAVVNIRKPSTTDSLQVQLDNQATMTFAFSALSTVFSYLAIEAYINYELFIIWQHSRLAHDAIDQIKQTNPELNAKPIYDEFYQKYGHIDAFLRLKDTNLAELKEKIKVVCTQKGLPQIHESKPALWQQFLGLLEETRHALVHPNPDTKVFAKTAERVFSSKPHSEFPSVASQIISHFFLSSNVKPPDYLNKNQLFEIKEIDILF